jgi:hypothetical protein
MNNKKQIPLSNKGLENYEALPARGRGDIMKDYVDIMFDLIDAGYSKDILQSLSKSPLPEFPVGTKLSESLNALSGMSKAGFDTKTMEAMSSPKLAFILKATTGDQFLNTENPLLQRAMLTEFAIFIGCNTEGVFSDQAAAPRAKSLDLIDQNIGKNTEKNTEKKTEQSIDVVGSSLSENKSGLENKATRSRVLPKLQNNL